MENEDASFLSINLDDSSLTTSSMLQYRLEQNLGLGLRTEKAIELALFPENCGDVDYRVPNEYRIIPFGIPDGDKPPPIALPLDIDNDSIISSLKSASQNVAVIRYQQSPYFRGTGFFIGPDTILTAAHVAEFFIKGSSPTIWVHSNDGFGQARKRNYVKAAYVLNSWQTSEGRSETDIGILRLKFSNKNFSSVLCGPLNKKDALVSGGETPILDVSGKIGGPLKLLSFFDQNPKYGLAKKGLQITTGSYLDAHPRTAMSDHVLGGHNIRSYKAWSGAAVLQTNKENPTKQLIVGVHVHGAYGINLFAGFSKKLIGSLNKLAKGHEPSSGLWKLLWENKV